MGLIKWTTVALTLCQITFWHSISLAEGASSLCDKSPAFVAAIEDWFERNCNEIGISEYSSGLSSLEVQISSVDELGPLILDISEVSIEILSINFLEPIVLSKGALDGIQSTNLSSLSLLFRDDAKIQKGSIINFRNVRMLTVVAEKNVRINKGAIDQFDDLFLINLGGQFDRTVEIEIADNAFSNLKQVRSVRMFGSFKLKNTKRAAFIGVPMVTSLPRRFGIEDGMEDQW